MASCNRKKRAVTVHSSRAQFSTSLQPGYLLRKGLPLKDFPMQGLSKQISNRERAVH